MLEVQVRRQDGWHSVSYPATMGYALVDVAEERRGHVPPAVRVMGPDANGVRTELYALPAGRRPAPTLPGPSPTL